MSTQCATDSDGCRQMVRDNFQTFKEGLCEGFFYDALHACQLPLSCHVFK